MMQAEKQVLSDIVQIIQTLTVKVDALEGALIRRDVLLDTDRPALAEEFLPAALKDLAAVRTSIASLQIIESAKG